MTTGGAWISKQSGDGPRVSLSNGLGGASRGSGPQGGRAT